MPLPEGRTLHAHVWRAQVGRVPLLLLDSDIEENAPTERGVTDRLYGGDEDHRLRQEMLLGIGGVRAVRAYCAAHRHARSPRCSTPTRATPASRASSGSASSSRRTALGFAEALQAVRAGTVFTTHTPVPGRHRPVPARRSSSATSPASACPLQRAAARWAPRRTRRSSTWPTWACGSASAPTASASCTAHVSRGMFADLWPGFDEDDVPIGSITNGVHAPTWTARELVEMGTQTTSQGDPVDGRRRRCTSTASTAIDGRRAVEHPPDAARPAGRGGAPPDPRAPRCPAGATEAEVGWTATAFDPDVLTIGFARRVPSYKRLTLMLRDPERLKALLLDPERPMQLVIAGKSHPADDGGKKLIQQMVAFADDPEIRHRIAFLPGYDIGMARYLYWGCDVWLNNPLRPLEACGTSGMKAALNGGLNLSIRDGWWDEWFDGQNGWAIPTADGVADADRRDEVEARAIYDLLEQPGAAAVLRDRPRRRPGPLGRDGAAHAARDRPQGARHPDGARLRAGAVRAGRRLGAGHGRRRVRARRARRPAWRAHLLHNWHDRAGGPRRGDRRRRHPGDRRRRSRCGPRWSCRAWRRATSRCRPPTAGSTTPTGCTR